MVPRWLAPEQPSFLPQWATIQCADFPDDTTGTNEFVQRVDQIGNAFAGVSHHMVTADGLKYVQWINPAAFALPTPGTFGTMGRNKIYGPAYGSVIDLSVLKNFRVAERFTCRFCSGRDV